MSSNETVKNSTPTLILFTTGKFQEDAEIRKVGK